MGWGSGLQVIHELGEKGDEGKRKRREEMGEARSQWPKRTAHFPWTKGDQMAESLSDVRTPWIPTEKNGGVAGLTWGPDEQYGDASKGKQKKLHSCARIKVIRVEYSRRAALGCTPCLKALARNASNRQLLPHSRLTQASPLIPVLWRQRGKLVAPRSSGPQVSGGNWLHEIGNSTVR